jgi:hypothetical protein
MIGSVFIAALAHNDQGMQKMLGLNDYLVTLLNGQQLPPSFVFLLALYADGIFPLFHQSYQNIFKPID